MEARKAQIAQTAEEFLYCMYDSYGERGKSIIDNRRPGDMYGFVNRGSLQSGWPMTRMLSFGGVQAISENEVTYSLTYEWTMGVGNSSPSTRKWEPSDDSGRIVFGENGLIDQWYTKGSPNGRLVKY